MGTALNNLLVHTQLHNRLQEEQDCWEKQEKLKSSKVSGRKKRTRKKYDDDDDVSTDDEEDNRKRKKMKRDTYEVKKTSPCEKWGHSGFNELHPEELISGNYLTSGDKKKTQSPKKEKKSKKHKKTNKHKKSNRKKNIKGKGGVHLKIYFDCMLFLLVINVF